MLVIRTGKEIFKNILGVKVVWLTEGSGRDRKYRICPVDGYEDVGDRVCNRHQNIFNLMSSLKNFIILIFLPQI